MLEIIQPIIEDVYGKSRMAEALSEQLVQSIKSGTWTHRAETREDAIRLICWDWFSGGDTAAIVAGRIEHALVEAGR